MKAGFCKWVLVWIEAYYQLSIFYERLAFGLIIDNSNNNNWNLYSAISIHEMFKSTILKGCQLSSYRR